MNRFVILAALAVPAAAAAQTGDASAGGAGSGDMERAAATISAEDFARRVGVIAHDSMRGRDTPSPELEETALWIAGEFERFGLRPGGDEGSFLQRYPIRMAALEFERSAVRSSGGVELAFGPDVLPLAAFGAVLPAHGEGGVVVLTGGTDFDEVEQWELAGRHAIVVLPRDLPRAGQTIPTLVRALRARQVASVILPSQAGDAQWESAASALREARFPARRDQSGGGPAVLQVRDAALARILTPHGVDVQALRDAAGGSLRRSDVPGLTLRVTQEVRTIDDSAPNVVGILEGSDPTLREEYVVFSGHMDHVGVGRPDERGDSIYNGADDDASGTVAVVEVAEAMASLENRPARSMIFVLVSGEEKGLWGSAFFAENPPVPVERMVANFNADMVGRNWSDTIVAIGREHSDLGETLARVNGEHPELGMTAIDDIWPEERFYFRSDHYNFARRGVPILFFFNGTHEDYHRPSDEPEKIDAEKAARIARLLFYLGTDVADAPERPRWNPESYRQIVEGARSGR